MTEAVAAVARIPKGDFSIEPVSVEAPRVGEVLVKIAGVGLCHTDLIFRDQFAPYTLPAILGHEGSGIIEALGEGVTGLAVGDKVVLGFSSCGDCPRCDEGLPSYCRSFVPLNYAGVRLEDGSTACCSGDERIGSHFFGQSIEVDAVEDVDQGSVRMLGLGLAPPGLQHQIPSLLGAVHGDLPERGLADARLSSENAGDVGSACFEVTF